MSESEVLSFAKKQRHAKLLEKIRNDKGLTPSELTELEEYEQASTMPKPNKKGTKKATVKPNERRELFCREYVKDFNGTQAAIRAGYSKATADRQASRLLRNAGILKRVEKLKADTVKKSEITLQRVLEELAKVALSNIGDIAEFGRDGVELYESSTLTRDQLACVSEVSSGSMTRKKRGAKVKLHSKTRALDSLLKYFVAIPGTGEEQRKIIRMPLQIKK